MKVGNFNIGIAFPAAPPTLAADLSAFLASKYKHRAITPDLQGKIRADVVRFVQFHWRPVVTLTESGS